MAEDAAFQLGEPALVCRWRMVKRRVPLLNRHIRALSRRMVAGAQLSRGVLSWAKQHVEWSLADDTTMPVPDDGVLMLVVDTAGQAAMSVGPYEPLPDAGARALAARAADARREAAETGVAPEVLCAVHDGALLVAALPDEPAGGALSLIEQLAQVRGIAVRRMPEAAGASTSEALLDALPGAVALVSDEHGVVVAADAVARAADGDVALAASFAQEYQKLLDAGK